MEKFLKISGMTLAFLVSTGSTQVQASVDRIQSEYTPALQSLTQKKYAEKAVKTINSETMTVKCLSHTSQPNFIGVSHGLMIRASLEKVAAAIEDFPAYEDLFEDIDRVEILNRKTDDKNENKLIRVHTEQNIPVPFIPNAHVTSDYVITRPSPSLQVYRYQLVKVPKHDDVFHSDGVIILEKRGEKETAYFEVDFLNANWGIVASVAEGRIWPDSIKGFLSSDLSLKIFTELDTTDKDLKKSRKEARKSARDLLDKKQIEACIGAKTAAMPYLKSFID